MSLWMSCAYWAKVAETLKDQNEFDEYLQGLKAFEAEKRKENDAKFIADDKKKKQKVSAGSSATLSAGYSGD